MQVKKMILAILVMLIILMVLVIGSVKRHREFEQDMRELDRWFIEMEVGR